MLKNISFIICFIFSFEIIVSNEIDSLNNLLNITDGKEKLEVYVRLSKTYSNSSPTRGIAAANEGLILAEHLDDTKSKIQLYKNIGLNFRVMGNYKNSLTNFLTALDLSEEINDLKEKGNVLNNIGNVYNYIGNIEKALSYYNSAYDLRAEIDDQKGLAGSLNNIGNIYISKKDYELALDYLKRSLALKLELNEFTSAASTYKNIGKIYYQKKQIDSSIIYYNYALDILDPANDELGIAHTYIMLANSYIEGNELNKAEELLNHAYNYTSKANANHYSMDCKYNLYRIYSIREDYQTALNYFKEYFEIRNKIYDDEIARQSIEVEAIYENLAIEKDLQNLALSEQTLQRNFFIVTTVFLAIIAFVFIVFFRERDKSAKAIKRTNKELQIEADKAERANKLKSEFLAQISHEIRTPVNTIMNWTSLIQLEFEGRLPDDLKDSFISIENAATRLLRTIDLVLNMSDLETGTYEVFPTELFLKEDVIKPIYKEFTKNNKNKNLEFKLLGNGKDFAVTADKYSLNQIMANLIDNAFKYTKDGTIEIDVIKEDDKIAVKIKDTGIGISEEYLPNLFDKFSQEEQGYTRKYEGTGLGLSLVKKYCEINNCEIKVDSVKGQGTTFKIIFN